MPGVGKTTNGKLIATKTGRKFVDSDVAFTEKLNKTPATYILEKGEKAFRDGEEEVLKEILKENLMKIFVDNLN
jgi:shikimate kinase